jgi:hypothetical protein
MRAADPRQQPQLRLGIEGRHGGEVFYQFGEIGITSQGLPARARLTADWVRMPVALTEVPVEGLKDIRVAIDLMGPGEVWIDDIEVFDLHFDEQEWIELVKIAGSAHANRAGNKLAASHRLLTGYWPSFLERHVPLPEPRTEAAFAPPKPAAPAGVGPMPPAADQSAPDRASWLDPRTWVPKKWW